MLNSKSHILIKEKNTFPSQIRDTFAYLFQNPKISQDKATGETAASITARTKNKASNIYAHRLRTWEYRKVLVSVISLKHSHYFLLKVFLDFEASLKHGWQAKLKLSRFA